MARSWFHRLGTAILLFLGWGGFGLEAKIDLVSLPERDGIKLTIYNSHDLTLVKDSRTLTFKQGRNLLQYSWAGTKIDPTSLQFLPLKNEDKLSLTDISYPKNSRDTLVWSIECAEAGEFPIEISYFTSGLSWRAMYLWLTNSDERSAEMKLYVTLNNQSGEDYSEAATRLVVGKLNLVEEISVLANKKNDADDSLMENEREIYDSKDKLQPSAPSGHGLVAGSGGGYKKGRALALKESKKIFKEGLSEYFLYDIEGKEDLPNGWGKKLINMKKEAVPIVAFYKYDPDRWGEDVRRFLRFHNTKENKLGEEPLPDGSVMVYRITNGSGALELLGQTAIKYVPIGQKEDLDLGAEKEMSLTRRLMDYHLTEFTFDYKGNITGWNEIKYYEIEVKNLRPTKNKLEIKNHFENKWDVEALTPDKPLKDDYRTLKYDLVLEPYEVRKVGYKIIQYQGKNAENK